MPLNDLGHPSDLLHAFMVTGGVALPFGARVSHMDMMVLTHPEELLQGLSKTDTSFPELGRQITFIVTKTNYRHGCG